MKGNISTKKIKKEKSISTEEAQLVGNTVQPKVVEGNEFKASISQKPNKEIKDIDVKQTDNKINKDIDNKTLDDYGER